MGTRQQDLAEYLTNNPYPDSKFWFCSIDHLEIEVGKISFAYTQTGHWAGHGLTVVSHLTSSMSGAHTEIDRVVGLMATAKGMPNPQHAADLAKIAEALDCACDPRVKRILREIKSIQSEAAETTQKAQEVIGFVQKLLTVFGIKWTDSRETVLATAQDLVRRANETDPLSALGAPKAYDNGVLLTTVERLDWLRRREG